MLHLPDPALTSSVCSPQRHSFPVIPVLFPAVICVPCLSHVEHLHPKMPAFLSKLHTAASVSTKNDLGYV